MHIYYIVQHFFCVVSHSAFTDGHIRFVWIHLFLFHGMCRTRFSFGLIRWLNVWLWAWIFSINIHFTGAYLSEHFQIVFEAIEVTCVWVLREQTYAYGIGRRTVRVNPHTFPILTILYILYCRCSSFFFCSATAHSIVFVQWGRAIGSASIFTTFVSCRMFIHKCVYKRGLLISFSVHFFHGLRMYGVCSYVSGGCLHICAASACVCVCASEEFLSFVYFLYESQF